MPTTPAIQVDRLVKHFGSVRAVEDVSFTVPAGEVYGFMGHNGAGKTTVLRMLLGLTAPDAGTGTVLGLDIARDTLAIRQVTGYLPGSYALPGDMTAHGFLHYIAAMFGLSRAESVVRVDELLERFALRPVAHRKLRGFSTGMTQKVGLAQALVNRPKVLLLDEPTAGLDPLGRHELLELLREQARDHGVTVLFSSHILSDVEALCENVAILHHGRLVAAGPLATLKTEHGVATTDALYLALARTPAKP